MTKQVMAKAELEMDALTLMDFVNEHIGDNHDLVAVYVQDDEGKQFSKISLIEETLSDGSTVHNLVLAE